MTDLTRDQVGDVLRSMGFCETQAAGKFYWYEYPAFHWRRRTGHPIARIQFYEPASEIQGWIYWPAGNRTQHAVLDDYVHYGQNVRTLAAHLLRQRLVAIAADARAPAKLIDIASVDDGGAAVLSDWLLEHGVNPFE